MSEIRFLCLRTARLEANLEFYTEVLQLPLLAKGLHYGVVQVGASQLMWEATGAKEEPFYHFAFDIPRNQLSAAAEWLAPRLDLLTQDGKCEFAFEDWNATSVYFHDPAGNIVELICRHNLDNDNDEAFSNRQILRISEIGWPVSATHPAPPSMESELEAWRDYGAFKALGAETGLVLLVPEGRGWLPTRRAAESHPCTLAIYDRGRCLHYRR